MQPRVSRCLLFLHRVVRRPGRALSSIDAEPPPDEAGRSHEPSSDDPEAVKLQILDSAIANHVSEHGWTRRSLQEAATGLGLPSAAHGLFPHGGFDLVCYFQRSCNDRLASLLTEEPRQPTGAFVRRALQTRLNMVTPHVVTWPQAMAIQALPQHAPTSMANLGRLVDEVWYLAGDASTDMTWYTKRLELAAVYKASELFLLQDRSPSFADTWAFMDRRLEDVTTSGVGLTKLVTAGTSARELVTGLGLIARNVTRL